MDAVVHQLTLDSLTEKLAVSEQESAKNEALYLLSLIHISEPTRQAEISYAVFCLKKKKQTNQPEIQLSSITPVSYTHLTLPTKA